MTKCSITMFFFSLSKPYMYFYGPFLKLVQLCLQVKERTSNFDTYNSGSHVMEYGTKDIKPEKVYLYQGFDPETVNLPANEIHLNKQMDGVNQRDADLIFLWQRVSTNVLIIFS